MQAPPPENTLSVARVESARQLRQFIRLPYRLHAHDPNWVPPLLLAEKRLFDRRRHPFWKQHAHEFFTAWRGGACLGRITACYIPAQKVGYFGFLEAVDDPDVFQHLLHAAERWVRGQGGAKITGPYNPSINYELGFLTEGAHTPPYLMHTHHPAYYARRMEQAGYRKATDFYAYRADVPSFAPDAKLVRTAAAADGRNRIVVRRLDRHRLNAELEQLRHVYNDAFSGHFGFLTMTAEEFAHMGADMKQIADFDLIWIAECNGEMAGFILALPNLNDVLVRIRDGRLFPYGIVKLLRLRPRIKTARVLTMGFRHKFRHLGLGSLLYLKLAQNLAAKGYHTVEMSWVAEENAVMRKMAGLLGGTCCKTWRLFEKPLA